MSGTSVPTVALNPELTRVAPSVSDQPWFETQSDDWHFEHDCIDTLLTLGIGEHDCPTIGDWLGFSLVGAIVAALTSKYITPPDPQPLNWEADMERYTWEAFWQAVEENPTKLDHAFLGAMLRQFIPRWHSAPPDRPYLESHFVGAGRWSGGYAGPMFHSIGNLDLKIIKQGREALKRLPEPTVASIRKVAQHVPPMLEIAISRIRKTYHW